MSFDIGINGWKGCVQVSYVCDKCKKMCHEMSAKGDRIHFVCKRCDIRYSLPKKLEPDIKFETSLSYIKRQA